MPPALAVQENRAPSAVTYVVGAVIAAGVAYGLYRMWKRPPESAAPSTGTTDGEDPDAQPDPPDAQPDPPAPVPCLPGQQLIQPGPSNAPQQWRFCNFGSSKKMSSYLPDNMALVVFDGGAETVEVYRSSEMAGDVLVEYFTDEVSSLTAGRVVALVRDVAEQHPGVTLKVVIRAGYNEPGTKANIDCRKPGGPSGEIPLGGNFATVLENAVISCEEK